MNFSKSISFLGFITIFLFSNCKTKKVVPTITQKKTNPCSFVSLPTNETIFSYFKTQHTDIQWLSGDCDVDVDMGGRSISLNMNVRMRRDSIIWLNMTKWGINAARVLIRPDSIFVLNYIQNQVIMLPISAAKDKLGVDLNFGMLQNMFLGIPTWLGSAENLTISAADSGLAVKNQKDIWTLNFLFNKNCELQTTTLQKADEQGKMTVSYADYAPFNAQLSAQMFSFSRQIKVQGVRSGDGTIGLVFDKSLEINIPKKMRFEIPNDYKKIDKF